LNHSMSLSIQSNTHITHAVANPFRWERACWRINLIVFRTAMNRLPRQIDYQQNNTQPQHTQTNNTQTTTHHGTDSSSFFYLFVLCVLLIVVLILLCLSVALLIVDLSWKSVHRSPKDDQVYSPTSTLPAERGRDSVCDMRVGLY